MKDIQLTYSQFLEFDFDDQFGFFYNDDGYPNEDAYETFEDDVKGLYQQFEFIIVTPDDNIYGLKSGERTLVMENVNDAYSIAQEVTEYPG